MKKFLLVVSLMLTFLMARSQQVTWLHNFELAKTGAKNTGKLMLVDFWATWCGPCKRMDAEVWSAPEAEALKTNFIPVKVDIDIERALAQQYGIRTIPHVVLMNGDGEIVLEQNGYSGKDRLLSLIRSIPGDVSAYYDAIDQKDDFKAAIELQELIAKVSFKDLTNSLANLSDKHLKRFQKKVGKENDNGAQLYLILNMIYRGREKKAIEELEAISDGYKDSKNEALYLYVLAKAFKGLKDETNYQTTIGALSSKPDGSSYLAKLN